MPRQNVELLACEYHSPIAPITLNLVASNELFMNHTAPENGVVEEFSAETDLRFRCSVHRTLNAPDCESNTFYVAVVSAVDLFVTYCDIANDQGVKHF